MLSRRDGLFAVYSIPLFLVRPPSPFEIHGRYLTEDLERAFSSLSLSTQPRVVLQEAAYVFMCSVLRP